MKFYLVRHGQTLFNKNHRIQGWCDSPLTKEGVEKARKAGKYLQNIEFKCAYTSTSERCYDTANYIIENREIPLHLTKGLKEVNFGEYEGCFEKDVQIDAFDPKKGFESVGGDSIDAVSKRMMNFIDSIKKDDCNDNILLVSHFGSIMNLLLKLGLLDEKDFFEAKVTIPNCSVTILNYENNKFHLEQLAYDEF